MTTWESLEFLFQNAALLDSLSIEDNLKFCKKIILKKF